MNANYCRKSDIDKAYRKGIHEGMSRASEKVTKTLTNIVNNILEKDFEFSQEDMSKFNDKLVAVIMNMNEEFSGGNTNAAN